MKIIILIFFGILSASAFRQSDGGKAKRLSCKAMLSMPEYADDETVDPQASFISLNSKSQNHQTNKNDLHVSNTHPHEGDVMQENLFVQNKPSSLFKKSKSEKSSNLAGESIFLGMKTGDDAKDHIPKNDVKDRLIEADEEINAEFQQCRTELHDQAVQNAADFNVTLNNLTEAIYFACRKMEKEIHHLAAKEADKQIEIVRNATLDITNKLRQIGDDVDDTIESNIRLRMLWLKLKIQQDTEQRDNVEAQANELEATLPPAESICELYLECSMCLANPKCGWCSRENMCVEGDNVAPLHYVCLQYDYKICRGSSCNMNIDCENCIKNELCGWCDADNMCLERTSTFAGCSDGWYNQKSDLNICPAAQLTQEEIEQIEEHKDKIELRRADVESEIDSFTSDRKSDRESRLKLIHLQQRVLDLTRKIDENQKELDHLTSLMEEYEACVQLSIKRHNRKLKYYRKKHEEELAAAEAAQLNATQQAEQQGSEAQEDQNNNSINISNDENSSPGPTF